MSWRNRKDEEDKRKKIESPFDFFSRFFNEDVFNNVFQEMDELMRNMSEGDTKGITRKTFGPYYYGRISTIGPDGEPVVREFSNYQSNQDQIEKTAEVEESLIDVFIEDDIVRIIAEIPGVEKEDIDIKATESKVILKARSNFREYNSEKELDVKIFPKTASAKYNNGVLEVTFSRQQPEEDEEEFEVGIL